jgi:hypothetical protein
MRSGPDWRRYVRERLQVPEVHGRREQRMVNELADHLDDVYREALSHGGAENHARAGFAPATTRPIVPPASTRSPCYGRGDGRSLSV